MYKIWNYFYYHWFYFNRHTCSIFMKLSCFKTKYRVKFTHITLLPQSCGEKCTTLFSRWYTYEHAKDFFGKSDSSTQKSTSKYIFCETYYFQQKRPFNFDTGLTKLLIFDPLHPSCLQTLDKSMAFKYKQSFFSCIYPQHIKMIYIF